MGAREVIGVLTSHYGGEGGGGGGGRGEGGRGRENGQPARQRAANKQSTA